MIHSERKTIDRRETKTHVICTYEVFGHRYTMKKQKFLCVNGPLYGNRLPLDEAKGYIQYNRSHRCKDRPKAVLVWEEQ